MALDDGEFVVTVTDNGAGLGATSSLDSGRGVLGMRERAELLGGSLEAGPGATGGITITARIPDREAHP